MRNVLALIPGHIASTAILLKPLEHLHNEDYINLTIRSENSVNLKDIDLADVVVMIRNTNPACFYLYQYIYETSKPIIYELDDNLLQVPVDNPAAPHHRNPEVRSVLEWLLQRSQIVRVYSPVLKRVVEAYNANVHLVDPAIDWELVPSELPDLQINPIEIVYPSGLAGVQKFRSILPDLKEILNTYRNRVRLHVMGFRVPELADHPQIVFSDHQEYQLFFKHFVTHGYTIGLAPMRQGLFFQCKTNNKFREFAAAGIAGIYSNCPPYSDNVVHEETGLLVSNAFGGWSEAIRRLIEDESLIHIIRNNARKFVETKYNINKASDTWIEHLDELKNSQEFIQAAKASCQLTLSDDSPPPTRVLAILPGYIPPTIINVVNPLQYLQQRGFIDLTIYLEDEVQVEQVINTDIIVACRNIEPACKQIFDLAQRLGIPIIYDLDDNLLAIPRRIQGSEYYHNQERQAFVRWIMRNANLVRVYSPVLQNVVEQHNQHVIRVRSGIDWSVVPPELPKLSMDPVKIVYATSRIENDVIFMRILRDIKNILEYFGNRVQLHLLGFIPDDLKGYKQIVFHSYDKSYEDFMFRFVRAGYAIGLAPMPQGIFYECKTNTKFRDYAAAGAVGLYSDSPLYREYVIPDETGLLISDQPMQWFDGVKRLIEDPTLLEKIRRQARIVAQEEYNLVDVADKWLTQIENIAKPKKFSADIVNLLNGAYTHSNGQDQVKQTVGTTASPVDIIEPAIPAFNFPSPSIKGSLTYPLAATHDNFSGVDVLLGTHNRSSHGLLTLSIYDHTNVLRRTEMDLSGQITDHWLTFRFDPIINSAGKYFTLRFHLEPKDKRTKLSLYQSRPCTTVERVLYKLRLKEHFGSIQLHCNIRYSS